MTEITEELNYILPCNNSELYIKNIIKKIIYLTNKEQEISFMKEIENDKNKFIYENINLEKPDKPIANILLSKEPIPKENEPSSPVIPLPIGRINLSYQTKKFEKTHQNKKNHKKNKMKALNQYKSINNPFYQNNNNFSPNFTQNYQNHNPNFQNFNMNNINPNNFNNNIHNQRAFFNNKNNINRR